MLITSKWPSKCKVCGGPINKGDTIEWEVDVKGVSHPDCGDVPDFVREAEMNVYLETKKRLEREGVK